LLEAKGCGNLTVCELKTFAARLSYLVQIGCKPYELVEYPMILLLNESEINQRVEKLRLAISDHKISIALLKYASPKKSNTAVKNDVVKYLQPLGGCVSKVDKIVQELNCSDTKMMEILTRNPRLLGRYYRKDVAEKIRCLISNGARHEDLYRNTNLLNNKTLATIQSRAERLHKIGWIPLPLGLIGREDAAFEAVVKQQETQSNFITGPQGAGTDDVIRLLPPMSANRIAVIRPKIEYLLSEGYAASEILNCQRTLVLSLEKLKMAVCELKPYHLQCVDLAIVCHYALKRRILSSRRCYLRAAIARAIGCSSSALPPLPQQDRSFSAVKDIRLTTVVNAKYLREELGFTTEDLASVPLVLAHAPNIVRRHWNALDNADDTQAELSYCSWQANVLFRRHADNRRLRLNLLQYCVEKEANFSHACVSSWAEDSDDEFRVTETETTTLAAADGSGCGGDDLTFHDDGDGEGADRRVCDKLKVEGESDRNDDDVDPLILLNSIGTDGCCEA